MDNKCRERFSLPRVLGRDRSAPGPRSVTWAAVGRARRCRIPVERSACGGSWEVEEADHWLGLCETNQWASGADGPHQCARSERELMGQLRLRVLGSGRGRNACASSRSTGEGGQDMSTCMTTSARGVVPRRQPDSSPTAVATGCGFLWLPSIRGQFRSVMVARRRPGPEDGWRGGALHYCPPELFDGCAL